MSKRLTSLTNNLNRSFLRKVLISLIYQAQSLRACLTSILTPMELNSYWLTLATGPDGVPARILKMGATEIAPALATILRKSLETGQLPEDWRNANISPIFKKRRSQRLPSNYRPVSLTSICCKVMEHVIRSNVMDHLDKLNILTDNQHGFRHNRSCESQLILTTNDFAKSLDKGRQTDAIIMDFSKASMW